MTTDRSALSRDLLAGGAPWLPYWLGQNLGYPGVGAAAAALALALVRLRALREFKLFDLAILAFLTTAALDHAGVAVYPSDSLRRAALPLLLAAAAFVSIALRKPCTQQYAREMVAPHWWHNRHFFLVNRMLTAAWGSCFLIMAVLAWAVMPLDYGRLMTGAVSLALFMLCAWFTQVYPRWYRLHRYVPLVRAGKEPFLRSPRR